MTRDTCTLILQCLVMVTKGGGGEFQSHITRNFSIESRITDIFLTNQASRKEESVH